MRVQARSLWGLSRGGLAAIAVALTALGVVIAANIHLVAVSIASQPDCVAHVEIAMEGASGYRAAKPAC